MVALDGQIYLVDANSREALWSLSSGCPIYSSYQVPEQDRESGKNKTNASEATSDFYVDCGDDWALYLHGKSFGKVVCYLPSKLSLYLWVFHGWCSLNLSSTSSVLFRS